MTVITYIYRDFADDKSSTYKFRESVERLGLALVNISPSPDFVGHPEVLRLLYEHYKSLPANEPVIYADGADTYFLRIPEIPTDRIVYSTEKAIWPPTEEMREAWADEPRPTPWCFLNGGLYAGPAGMLADFFEKYGLSNIGERNAQGAQALAYLACKSNGGPRMVLDCHCKTFQSIAFAEDGDFDIGGGVLTNLITGTTPAVVHGNGRTPMGWVYNIHG